MLRERLLMSLVGLLLMSWVSSCTQVDITMPKGPKGDTGLSAYEVWKTGVADGTINWPKGEVQLTDFFKYLKGEDGKDGVSAYDQWKELVAGGAVKHPHDANRTWPTSENSVSDFWRFLTGATGENGTTPHVGENGNWWIGTRDTGTAARGPKGEDAVAPRITIGVNGNWHVNGVDTGEPSRGEAGSTPQITIGSNNNWFVDGVDTGKKAVGQDGQTPEVLIGENGNWVINGRDTGVRAYGKDGNNGSDGQNGLSAYEVWVKDVTTKCGTGDALMDPHNPGSVWPCDRTSTLDFWSYLHGADGSDGVDGENAPIQVEVGKYNVLPQYFNADLREYVSPADGSVTFQVYDKKGAKAPAGSVVKGLPGVSPDAVFTTDEEGLIKVPRANLPVEKPLRERRGVTASVTIGGVTEASAANTLVPNRVDIRLQVERVTLTSWSESDPVTQVKFNIERKINGEWKDFNDGIVLDFNQGLQVVRVKNHELPVDENNIIDNATIRNWKRRIYKKAVMDINVEIARPQILTESEKKYFSTQTTGSVLAQRTRDYAWDGSDHYFSFFYGDEEGVLNDYGMKYFVQDKIHSPEINPIPPLKNVRIEIKQGVSTLFGEWDVDQLSYHYKVKSDDILKDESTNVWTPSGGRIPASDINKTSSYYAFRLKISVNLTGTTGEVRSTFKYPVFPISRFSVVGAYPNGRISLQDYSSSYIYRDRYAYYLRYNAESDSYYLEDYFTKEKVMDVPKAPLPEDFMKY